MQVFAYQKMSFCLASHSFTFYEEACTSFSNLLHIKSFLWEVLSSDLADKIKKDVIICCINYFNFSFFLKIFIKNVYSVAESRVIDKYPFYFNFFIRTRLFNSG